MGNMNSTRSVGRCLTAGLMCAVAGSVTAGARVDIEVDFAADFPDPLTIDNPYWSLPQGRTFVYRAVEDDECLVNEVTVTGMVKSDFVAPYEQITARVVKDTEWADTDCDGTGDGEPLETTRDWYAQDRYGHIWYFGEATVDSEGSTEGSWEAGRDVAGVGSLAEPGIVMLAHPDIATDGSVPAAPGLFYRQEYYEDEAQDMGKVLRLNARIGLQMANSLAVDEYTGCLTTKEWTQLERGAVEQKSYCPYTGLVLIRELSGGRTVRVELVTVLP